MSQNSGVPAGILNRQRFGFKLLGEQHRSLVIERKFIYMAVIGQVARILDVYDRLAVFEAPIASKRDL